MVSSFKVEEKTLKIKVAYSGMILDKVCDCVRQILEQISTPMVYAPKKIAVDGPPEIQYILSRMLGMEQEPVACVSTRKLGKKTLTLKKGFCKPDMTICGGQLDVQCVSFPLIVTELMKRSPLKTLVVVEKCFTHLEKV